MAAKIKEKEIYYGRELFKALRLYLPSDIMVGEHRPGNGLIQIRVMKSYNKQFVGIEKLIEIGENAPIKAADLEELCKVAAEKISEQITQLQNA